VRDYNINDIADLDIRNLMRGLLNKPPDEKSLSALNRLRRMVGARDLEIVTGLFMNSPLFRLFDLYDDFPNVPRTTRYLFRPDSQPLEHELTAQCVRIRAQEAKLLSAIDAIANINETLRNGDYTKTIDLMNNFIQEFGHSLFLLRKIVYLSSQVLDDIVATFCKEQLALYGYTKRNAIALALVDLIGDKYDMIILQRTLLEFSSNIKSDRLWQDILTWHLRPIKHLSVDIANILNSMSCISLIDTYTFLLIHYHNLPIIQTLLPRLDFSDLIPETLLVKWIHLSNADHPPVSRKSASWTDDEHYYRQSIAWIELGSVSRYRDGFDAIYLEHGRPAFVGDTAQRFLDAYFHSITSPKQLIYVPDSYQLAVEEFNTTTAGHFDRTIAFIYMLRRGLRAALFSPDELLVLMNQTKDVAGVRLLTIRSAEYCRIL
jgi:hypothetical protein